MDDLDKLKADYPKLFSSNMNGGTFYFEHGPGWAPLLRRLAERLQVLSPDARCVQCKEKFGTLRFYPASCTDAGFRAIDAAEHESSVTCELCGATGDYTGQRWIRVLCKPCTEKTGPK